MAKRTSSYPQPGDRVAIRYRSDGREKRTPTLGTLRCYWFSPSTYDYDKVNACVDTDDGREKWYQTGDLITVEDDA